MTPNQYAAFFMALPFLALACAWMTGLALLLPKAKRVPVKKNDRKI